MFTKRIGVLAGLMVIGFSCSKALQNQIPPPNGEVTTAGPLSLDEREISAEVHGSQMLVGVPLRNIGQESISGSLFISVLGLQNDFKALGAQSFDIKTGSEVVLVTIPQVPPDLQDEGHDALYVIAYDVFSTVGTIKGKRSLFMAISKGQVALLAPKVFYAGEPTRVKLIATDPKTAKPLANQAVVLSVNIGDQKKTFKGTTDAFGYATFEVVVEDSANITLEATVEGTNLKVTKDARAERQSRVLVTTDKPMYQPGQEMHIRVLALKKPELAPEKDTPCIIEVFDGKGNKVFKERKQTSDFGVAYARFKLGYEVNMGQYKIKATVGETVTEKAVTVDRYSLPKFKVDITLDKPYYLVGETVQGVLQARYFFGKPVSGGDVTIALYTYDVEFTKFGEVTGKTDQSGTFAFQFTLPSYMVGQTLEQGKAIVRLVATVFDNASQKVEKEVGFSVAKDALDVVVIPESGEVAFGVENRFFVFVEDAASNPVQANIKVEVGDSELDLQTDADGFSSFTLTPVGTELTMTLSLSDAKGHIVQKTVSFGAKSTETVLVRTDKAIYKVGDTMKVFVFAPDSKDRVYLDVLRQYQVVREETLDLSQGKAQVEIDLDQEMSGDLVLTAYYLGRLGDIIRDEKFVLVEGSDALNISIQPEKQSYLPAEEAKVRFKVTDEGGNPKVAALGVQVVDEAVYALSEAKPGLLETYFKLQEELLNPRFEIHYDSSAIPDIVSEEPQGEDKAKSRERKAEAVFAALGNQGIMDASSSWKQSLAKAREVLAPVYQSEKQRVMDSLLELLKAQTLTYDTVIPYLEKDAQYFDPFGNLYTFTHTDDYTIKMVGRGPDEIIGTEDDMSATFSVWDIGGYWMEDGPWGGAAMDASVTPPEANGGDKGATQEPRVRKFFPETLFVAPELITNENGEAVADFVTADSITEWRITTVANSSDGLLGSKVGALKVFMDFFVDTDVPRVMRRGDYVEFPIAVYNYLDRQQTVRLEIEADDFAELSGDLKPTVTLGPSEVQGVKVGLRAKKVGFHGVLVKAFGSEGVSDAVQRLIEVVPDGVEVRQSDSGKLEGTIERAILFPDGAIEGSEFLTVKIYPGVMAQAVEGLDSILQMPSGCFEQTTATLWPNALVLDYMQKSGKITPEIELKAREYINVGYQRLLTFECTGGGFTWFGDPNPPNIILSAMGVMEFSDIGKVQEIDETIVPRTIEFLKQNQRADGSWHEVQGSEFATVQYDDLMTTCFVTWALGQAMTQAQATSKAVQYIKAHIGETGSIYAMALCANALATVAPSDSATQALLQALVAKAKEDQDKAWWEFEAGSSNDRFYGYGGDGTTIEVTALAVLALLEALEAPDLVSKALSFLASKKDSFGNWGTTHATILALKAFVKSLTMLVQKASGELKVEINGHGLAPLQLTDDNADVFYQFELKDYIQRGMGNNVKVSFEGEGSLMYQIVWGHYEEGEPTENPQSPLEIEVIYDKTHLAVDDIVNVTATIKNISSLPAPMVLVDLGIPPGFDVLTDSLEKAVADRVIDRFEMTAKQILVYLSKIEPMEQVKLEFGLRAKYPLEVTAPDSSAQLYYDPSSKTSTSGTTIEVK